MKWTFSQREHAIALLRAALPAEVVSAVDWGTLRVEKDSFVDRALRSRYSDLLISVRMGRERLHVYVLIEHQREVEALMVFRLLHYMVRLWDRLLGERPNAKTLPPIVPLLIHHSDSGWTAATAFQDVIAGSGPARAALERHIPRFDVRLIDLSEGRASDLAEQALTALGQVVMWCLSVAGDDARLEREIARIAAALDQVLLAPNGLAALEVLLRYLAATHTGMRANQVGKLLMKTAGPRAQEAIVTFLDEIELRGERRGEIKGERRGERRGEIKGERSGREKVLLDLLAARFGEVSVEVKERVGAADDATLARWTVRVLTEPTLHAVLELEAAPVPPKRRATPRKRTPRA